MRSWPFPYLPPASALITHPTLRLCDSYSGETVTFSRREVSMYVCGITPYDATHLGHAATYITFDLVNRYLRAAGVDVIFVENITDIDDPLFERAKRDSVDWKELATSQIELFMGDMTELRVIPPETFQGVIESMETIVDSVGSLIAKNLTYSIDGDIYLELSKVESSPVLPLDRDEALSIFAERGGDPLRPGKKDPLDPLLWKAKVEGEPSWSTPFGEGRPGWHIECVAIALGNLPQQDPFSISLQGGGSDLRFPHHFMTAVQSQALTGKRFAQCFVHAGMIGLDGEKMSKSRGNLRFVSAMINSGTSPDAIRLALMSRHYREDLMWSDEILNRSHDFLDRLRNQLSTTEVAPTTPVIQAIVDALADDLDTPKVFEIIEGWIEKSQRGITGGEAGELSRALDLYLGIAL